MATVISTQRRRTRTAEALLLLSDILPIRLISEVGDRLSEGAKIEEIRCRLGHPSFITVGRENIALRHISDSTDMRKMTDRLFGGSLYAHRETLNEGYVTIGGGIRVGVVGRAVTEGGRVTGIYDITSLNFRLPTAVYSAPCPFERQLREGKGVLVYSPPGVGKTTLLRSVSAHLSTGDNSRRVCVVDTRGELSLSGEALGGADVLIGYPKGVGIEIATRCMSPQLIVCDEIGSETEAEAVLSAAGCGVPILASAHGERAEELVCRSVIGRLHRGRVFALYAGLSRRGDSFDYTMTHWEELCDIF